MEQHVHGNVSYGPDKSLANPYSFGFVRQVLCDPETKQVEFTPPKSRRFQSWMFPKGDVSGRFEFSRIAQREDSREKEDGPVTGRVNLLWSDFFTFQVPTQAGKVKLTWKSATDNSGADRVFDKPPAPVDGVEAEFEDVQDAKFLRLARITVPITVASCFTIVDKTSEIRKALTRKRKRGDKDLLRRWAVGRPAKE